MTNSSICDKPSFSEALPKNEVVVMEDSEIAQEAIRKVMEDEFDFKVKIADSKEKAIYFAEHQELQYYILDVHMGNNRQQEGIDALEEIKTLNEKSFVSILTGYPSPGIQNMASRLGADLYREKSFDLENDIREIASKIKKRNRELLKEKLQIIEQLRKEIIDEIKKLDDVPHPDDPNIATYEKLKLEEEWFSEYQGKYVAFINGVLIDSSEDKQKLLDSFY